MTDITVGYHNDRLVAVRQSSAAPPADSVAPSTTDSWSVKPGDNLWVIRPSRGRALLEANADLVDPDLIMPGQMLTLPPLTAGS